jgi:protein gp37
MAMTAKYWDDPWNVTVGCTKTSLGCAQCYAERLASTRLAGVGDYLDATRAGKWTGQVRTLAHKLYVPLHKTAPRVWFVCNTSDLYHEQVPFPFIAAVYGVMAACPQHTFLVCTKWPDRRLAFQQWAIGRTGTDHPLGSFSQCASDIGLEPELVRRRLSEKALRGARWPLDNVWEGTTIEHTRYLHSRLESLMQAQAAHRWVSAEPIVDDPVVSWDTSANWLLDSAIARPASCECGHDHGFTRCPNYGDVSENCHHAGCSCQGFRRKPGTAIDWIAFGGESGPHARHSSLARLRKIGTQATRARVMPYLKQLGSRCGEHLHTEHGRGVHLFEPGSDKFEGIIHHPTGARPSEWPEDMRAWRELPWRLREMPLQ